MQINSVFIENPGRVIIKRFFTKKKKKQKKKKQNKKKKKREYRCVGDCKERHAQLSYLLFHQCALHISVFYMFIFLKYAKLITIQEPFCRVIKNITQYFEMPLLLHFSKMPLLLHFSTQ